MESLVHCEMTIVFLIGTSYSWDKIAERNTILIILIIVIYDSTVLYAYMKYECIDNYKIFEWGLFNAELNILFISLWLKNSLKWWHHPSKIMKFPLLLIHLVNQMYDLRDILFKFNIWKRLIYRPYIFYISALCVVRWKRAKFFCLTISLIFLYGIVSRMMQLARSSGHFTVCIQLTINFIFY